MLSLLYIRKTVERETHTMPSLSCQPFASKAGLIKMSYAHIKGYVFVTFILKHTTILVYE